MSSLRLISSRLKSNFLNSKTLVNRKHAVRNAYHYAESGGTYRMIIPPPPETNIRWLLVRVLFTNVWFWIFYNTWWDPNTLLGHADFQPPDPSQFTDEELGLPPEGEDDILFA